MPWWTRRIGRCRTSCAKDQLVTFLLRLAVLHIVHRRVKGLSAPWQANPLLFTEDLWLENER